MNNPSETTNLYKIMDESEYDLEDENYLYHCKYSKYNLNYS